MFIPREYLSLFQLSSIDQQFLIVYSAPGFKTRYLSPFVCLLHIEQHHLLPRRMYLQLCVLFLKKSNYDGVNKLTIHATTQSPLMLLNLSNGQVHIFFNRNAAKTVKSSFLIHHEAVEDLFSAIVVRQ